MNNDGIWLREGVRQRETEEVKLVEWEEEESDSEAETDEDESGDEERESGNDSEEEDAVTAVPRGRFDVLRID